MCASDFHLEKLEAQAQRKAFGSHLEEAGLGCRSPFSKVISTESLNISAHWFFLIVISEDRMSNECEGIQQMMVTVYVRVCTCVRTHAIRHCHLHSSPQRIFWGGGKCSCAWLPQFILAHLLYLLTVKNWLFDMAHSPSGTPTQSRLWSSVSGTPGLLSDRTTVALSA